MVILVFLAFFSTGLVMAVSRVINLLALMVICKSGTEVLHLSTAAVGLT